MKKFLCPNCSNTMSMDSTDGTLICVSCKTSIPVTDFEHHEFGNMKNSRYIKEYAEKNVDMHMDGFATENSGTPNQNTVDGTSYYVPFKRNAKDVIRILNGKTFGKLLFTHSFKNIIQKRAFEKIYVPVWSNEIVVKASVNAACIKFDRNGTHYFDVEKHVQLLFEQFNTAATTANGTLHLDSLFPYSLDAAECRESGPDAENEDAKPLQADVPPDRYAKNIKKYVENVARNKLIALLLTYSSSHNKIYEYDTDTLATKLIYLPVWKIPCSSKASPDFLYVNGQTGKLVGKIPFSILKCTGLIALIFIIIFSALITSAYFIGI